MTAGGATETVTRSRRRARPAPFRLAVVGKGGSGKSMVAGTLARLLARRGHRILALDSDPLPGLAISLGIDVGSEAMLEGLAERGPDGRWRVVRDLKAATLVRRAARTGPDGVLFLQFGKMEGQSNAPMMSSMQAFWRVTTNLRAGPWTIVHDLPAGTRQAYSGWAGSADVVLMVVEPTQKSILSARRLLGITEVAEGARLGYVANKVRRPSDVDLIARAVPRLHRMAVVPYDEDVATAERAGRAPIDAAPDSAAVKVLSDLAERIESATTKEAT